MLQHMQYTVDKCVYFLYSALLKPQNSKHNNNNQLPPCLPSQRLPESASALTTQLLSCRLLCVFALMYAAPCTRVPEEAWRIHAKRTASSYYAHPWSREWNAKIGTHCTSHSTRYQPTLWCHFMKPFTPKHRTTSATTHRTASPPCGQSGNQAPAPQTVFSWKTVPRKLMAAVEKRHKDL